MKWNEGRRAAERRGCADGRQCVAGREFAAGSAVARVAKRRGYAERCRGACLEAGARFAKPRWFAVAVAALLAAVPVCAQVPSQAEQLRIQIWAELDAFPGVFEDVLPDSGEESLNSAENGATADTAGSGTNAGSAATGTGADSAGTDALPGESPRVPQTVAEQDAVTNGGRFAASAQPRDISIFSYAINRAKEISPFLLGGMLDGWRFEYVPYDKTRRVEEFFEFSEVRPLNQNVNPITYAEPIARDDRLLCWAVCSRTPSQQLSYQRWASITHPRITGHGTASVQDGFAGIQAACAMAVKEAVREYWRAKIKNKPKEITGTVLLIQNPRIYIKDGQYVVDLDFFLETDRIVLYSYY